MTKNYSIGSTLQNQFLPSTNPQAPAKTGMLFAWRTLDANNSLIRSVGSTPQPNLYAPFKLGAYTDGLTALVELGKMGFQYSLGLSFNTTFSAPDDVIVDNASGLTTLVWDSTVMGIENLISQNPTGAATQGSTTSGTIRAVSIVGLQSFMVVVPVSGSTAFNTTDPVVIAATLANSAPNPETSDNVCVAVYWYYQQYVSARKFTTSPDLWVSVAVDGVDTDINPSGIPIDLVAPTTATVLGDGSVNLTYSASADNLGLLPTTYFKSSTVTQATSTATGTYNGYTLSGTNLIINVIDVTGTFNTTNTVEVELDVSTTGFSYIDEEEISSYAIAANISNYSQLTTTYPAFVAGVSANQLPGAVANKKYNVQGYFGFAFTQPNEVVLANMIAPDTTGWVATVRLDVPTIYQYPAIGFVQAVQHMFVNLNNQDPYYDDSGKLSIMNQAASSSIATYPTIAMANQLTDQGWTVYLPTTTGQLYVFRDVNCMQTNGGIQDGEYRYQSTQLKVRWVDKNLVEVGDATCVRPDGSRDNNNPELILRLNTNLQNVLTVGNDAGMLGAGGTLDISLSATDVTRFKVVATISVVSSNSGLDFIVVVKSYTV